VEDHDLILLRFPSEEPDLAIPAEVVEERISPHTGNTLRRLESDLTVPASEARKITAVLQDDRQLVDDQGRRWTGRLAVQSYGDPQGLHNLQINWDEQEHFEAEAVEFEGLVLRPLRYEERAGEGGGISLSFRARLSDDETEALRTLQRSEERYFPVIRRGISDGPRRMRFGRVLWQALDDQARIADPSLTVLHLPPPR
jgi:hypothetical protein